MGLLNRLESQSYTHVGARELPSLDSITYAYTPNGSLQQVVETKTTSSGPQLEQTTRGFDALERMTSQTRDYGSTQKTTLFGYDTKGNRTSVTDFTGASTRYTFDSVDRLKTATTPNGIATHVYFADGLLQRTEYRASAGAQPATVEKRCYDNASRLTTVASGPPNFMNDDCPATMGPVVFSRFDYVLDANGNRVTQREQRAATDEHTDYGYDDLDRLLAVAYPSEAVLYQLDAVGNRTGEKKTTRVAAQALGLVAAAFAALAPADTLANVRGDFNRADWLTARRTLSANGLSELSRIDFGHDANGNTTAEDSATSSREYRWDVRNTLTAALIDGLDVGRYSYDWQLQRVSRSAGGSTVEYVLDDKLVLQELDGTHATRRRYHFGALSPLGVSDSAGPRWLLNDGLGSVSDEVTPSGALFKQRQYNAWGEYRNSTAPTLNEPKLGYEGHQYDSETSLTYARARYLDNRYGVLLSRDSVEGSINDAPSLHRYTWARVGPLRFLDFTGNECSGQNCPPAEQILAIKESLREKAGKPEPKVEPKSAYQPETQGGAVAAEAILSAPGDVVVSSIELHAFANGVDVDGNPVPPEVQRAAQIEILKGHKSVPEVVVEGAVGSVKMLKEGVETYAKGDHRGARGIFYGTVGTATTAAGLYSPAKGLWKKYGKHLDPLRGLETAAARGLEEGLATGAAELEAAGSAPAVVDYLPVVERPPPGLVNDKIYAQLEKQLEAAGAKSIHKALRSAERTLAEHRAKLEGLEHKSQVEGTIRNVERQVETLKKFIKDKDL